MPYPYSWRPSRITPTTASQVKVLDYSGLSAVLSTPVSVNAGVISFALQNTGRYSIVVRQGQQKETGYFEVDPTNTDTSDPEVIGYAEYAVPDDSSATLGPIPRAITIQDILDPDSQASAALSATYATGQVHFIVSATEPAETAVDGKPVVWIDTSADPISVTATTPTFTDLDGTASDTYTIPTTTGVEYSVDGAVKAAGIYAGVGTVTVTAAAVSGYILSGTSTWAFTFSTGTAPVSVTPTAPTFDDSTDTYTIPTTTGVDYKVGGVTKAAGSYGVTAPTSVTVDAVAQSGYTLTGTVQWTGSFTVNPDTTAPTAPTNLAGTAGSTSMALTWTASTDAVGVTGYRVSKDNGATWVTSSVTGTSYTVTGLTASTSYTFAVAARDAAGNWSTNATLTKSTASSLPPQDVTETFAYADGTALAGKTTTTGGLVWDGTGGAQGWVNNNAPVITGGKITYGAGRVNAPQQNVATSASYVVNGTTNADKVMLYAAGPDNANNRAAASVQIKSSSTANASAVFYDAAGTLKGEIFDLPKSGIMTIRNNAGSWTLEVDGEVRMGPFAITAAAGNYTGLAVNGTGCTIDDFSVDYL